MKQLFKHERLLLAMLLSKRQERKQQHSRGQKRRKLHENQNDKLMKLKLHVQQKQRRHVQQKQRRHVQQKQRRLVQQK